MSYFWRLFWMNLLVIAGLSGFSQNYKSFKVAVYCRAYEVARMKDTTGYLKPIWDEISRQLKVDKIYLETHRDLLIVDQATLDIAKKFFKDRNIEIAGGITFTISEPNRFQTFCYSDPDDRKKVREITEYTAKNFNEVILDDFFFTDYKDDGAIKDKGSRSWTQYRLKLMTEAEKSLVVGPAKAVNPQVKMVIKFPNWYEHFQGSGFNLDKEPAIFDGIYTYLTNDSWEMASTIDGPNGWPILHEADYSKGELYVLTLLENFADLYNLPAEALNVIRKELGGKMNVTIEGSANISLYVYDNNTCIVESFLPETTELKIITTKEYTILKDLQSHERLNSSARNPQKFWFAPKDNGTNAFTVTLKPTHSEYSN